MPKKSIVPVVYQIFPHYRSGVNHELIGSSKFDYVFVADPTDTTNGGIEMWTPPAEARFVATRSLVIRKNILFQDKVLLVPFWRNVKQIIYLGDAYYVTTWISAALAKLMGKRVLFWSHGWIAPDKGIKRLIRLAFYKLADGLLLFGHHAKHIGIREGFRPENLHVIYNSLDYPRQLLIRQAIDLNSIPALRASLFSNPSLPVLICAGRLIPMRRLDLLIEALKILKQGGNEMNLLIVGDGPLRDSIESRTACEKLSVKFYGACYDEKTLAMLFTLSDMSVMAGRVGLAAIHSLTYGTPVLIHDDPNDQGPEWEAVIHGYNGVHFEHDNSVDLARSLVEWFSSARDRELIRKRCHTVIDKFYNPRHQAACIERALAGLPADDSKWEAFIQQCRKSV